MQQLSLQHLIVDVRHNNNALKELNDCIVSLLDLGPNAITFKTLLHLGKLLHLGPQQKSSFLAALMRMPDADGEIIIDDVPVKDIGLQQARRGISVLSQCPVLFSGSLRTNLDILDKFQDTIMAGFRGCATERFCGGP